VSPPTTERRADSTAHAPEFGGATTMKVADRKLVDVVKVLIRF
jgi:hypothetical protein